ncbi:SMC family ATPase [uncultured Schumannella sp.]|uniref:AAA family ATPase n=1 Tax=uncultured Schumannella sp. TaxID=1195956 RepID=UPI0025D61864|nr:SMC family ATPase [uncultured Schumannella sp.]
MRIRTVTIEGFGPFKDRQHVDFRVFDADGLFLIAGETGVGKTSILDAIAYALYNKTPRWDNVSATGAANAVRSDFCGVNDPTEVVVEFETNGLEYRVTRSPEYDRPKARGEGTTLEKARVLVEVLEGETWVGKATKEREAAALVESLLKLNKDEFLQVIMLAQGRFQEFLLATSEQRLELLSKLFGTGRFAAYQQKLADRRNELRKRLEGARAKQVMLVDTVDAPEVLGAPEPGQELTWLDAVIEDAEATVLAATRAVEAADVEEKAALARLEVARKQARAEAARQELATLEEGRPEIDAARAELERAARADRVRSVLDDAAEKREAWEQATSAVEAARGMYTGDADDEALGDEVTRLTEEIGELAGALQDEQRTQSLATEITAKTTACETLATKLTAATESIAALQEERGTLVPTAAQAASAGEDVTRAKARLAAATEAATVAEELRRAQELQLAADQRVTAARAEADAVLARFLSGQAAVLAETLEDGEPCAVCGSTEHPSPAAFAGERVTQDDVDAAQAAVDTLESPAKAARDRVDELKVRAAGLSASAGDGDLDALTAAAEAAEAALAGATAAAARIDAIDAELTGGAGADAGNGAGLLAERERLEASSKAASSELTALQAEHDSLAKKLAALRGEFASVAARQASRAAERDAAKALAEALATLAQATTQRTASDSKLATKLSDEKFESTEEAEAALRSEAQVGELTKRIDEHATSVSENQGILKQADLQDLPEEIVSVDEASAGHVEAQRASRAATAAKANAEGRRTQLRSRRTELAELLASTAELAEEFELQHRLTETVHGRTPNTKSMSLESYYIAAELEDVLAAANIRLQTLSQGRFELRHTERGVRRAGTSAGLEIEVFDEFTGTARPANQLSGGQQFLASLALALGLAEAVTSRAGGIELNTLFVDEGFGSLSTEYLEIAMSTLDSLKQGGRTVGVISHVTSMQEQIAAQLRVVAEPGGPSRIAVDGL